MQSFDESPKKVQVPTFLIVIIFLTSLFAGVISGYYLGYLPLSTKIDNLESQMQTINQLIVDIQTSSTVTAVLGGNISFLSCLIRLGNLLW